MKPFSLFWFASLVLLSVCEYTSSAQTVWTKSAKNPVLTPGWFNGITSYGIDGAFDTRYAMSPSVLFKNGLYKMWYVGYESSWTGLYTIGYAISEDGVAWNTYTKNPVLTPGSGFDNRWVWLSVVTLDSAMTMYYSGYDGIRWSVGIATSSDGIGWTKHTGNPVLTVGSPGAWDDNNVWGVSVVKIGPTDYRMWYTGTRNDGRARIGHATSSDGVHWTKFAGNPILEWGSAGSWESQGVLVPRVVYADGVFHMFYMGNPPSDNTQIGYAYSTDGIQWTKHPSNPVLQRGTSGQWDSFSLGGNHCVLLEGNILRIWYGARNDLVNWQIGLATSSLSTDVPTQRVLPAEFKLSQNYPNPFNPSTTIEYDVPARARITLKVYNTLGQEVATLVDEERMPGTYSAVWEANGVASGTYWSRMAADGKSVVQKMVLLK
jgi:predicted GH43/DUF377 family glycosyl hydrolase